MWYAKSAVEIVSQLGGSLWSYIPAIRSTPKSDDGESGPPADSSISRQATSTSMVLFGRSGIRETLFDVIYRNDWRRLDALIKAGYPLSSVYSESGLTPLQCAAELGRDYMVTALLTGGARVNETDHFQDPESGCILGNTALHYAASEGWATTTLILLDGGAEVNLQNAVGWTPLHLAIIGDAPNPERRMATVMALMDAGADVNRTDGNGHLPADLALLTGRVEIMRILLNAGTELARMQPLGPLYAILAKSEECVACVKLAMRAGAYSARDLAAFVEFAYRVMGCAEKYVVENLDDEYDRDVENEDEHEIYDLPAIMPPIHQETDLDEVQRLHSLALDEEAAIGEIATVSSGHQTQVALSAAESVSVTISVPIPPPTNGEPLVARNRRTGRRASADEGHHVASLEYGRHDDHDSGRDEWSATMEPSDLEMGAGTGIWTSGNNWFQHPDGRPHSAVPPKRPQLKKEEIYILNPEALPRDVENGGINPETNGDDDDRKKKQGGDGEEGDWDWDDEERVRYGEYQKELLDELGITLVMYTKCKTLKMWARVAIRRHLDGHPIGRIIGGLAIPLEYKNYILLANDEDDE